MITVEYSNSVSYLEAAYAAKHTKCDYIVLGPHHTDAKYRRGATLKAHRFTLWGDYGDDLHEARFEIENALEDYTNKIIIEFDHCITKKRRVEFIARAKKLGFDVESLGTVNECSYRLMGALVSKDVKQLQELSDEVMDYGIDHATENASFVVNRLGMVVAYMEKHGKNADDIIHLLDKAKALHRELSEILRTIQDRHDRPYESKGS